MKLCVAIKEGDAHGRVIEDVRRVVRLPSYASDWSDVFFPQCFPRPRVTHCHVTQNSLGRLRFSTIRLRRRYSASQTM